MTLNGLAQKEGQPLAAPKAAPQKDADTLALEKMLTDNLGLEVTINHRNHGGQVRVEYKYP